MLHKFRVGLACSMLALAPTASVLAGPVLMTFEEFNDSASVSDFYPGIDWSGPDGDASYVSLDLDSTYDPDGTGRFANAPSGERAVSLSRAFMNVAAGFNAFSFYYSSSGNYTVQIFDGLNGTGALLETLNLTAQYNLNNCSGDPTGAYCNWTQVTATLTGTAKSAVFSRGDSYFDDVYFDDVFVNVLEPHESTDIPEPMTATLVGFAFASLVMQRRRMRAGKG